MENYFNERANSWDDLVKPNKSKIVNFLNLLEIKNGDKILDVGSGTGVLIPFLDEKVGKEGVITAIDFSENMIEIARDKYPSKSYPNVKFKVDDATKINLNPTYDTIICYSSFPHFTNKEKAIDNLSKGLKKGGNLIIAHPDSRKKINERHRNIGGAVSNHLLPTLSELIKMLEMADLRVKSFKDTSEMFFILAVKKEGNFSHN
jgi:demethylmenaquinone methyltransferase/2-methoxy-6-polyprenyl-1,4-benzoquinol methylase